MKTLRIYKIKDKYISYLHNKDNRVQFNKNHSRPYVGVVLYVGEYKYFVPMESPKPNHCNIKPGKHIVKLDGGRLGMLGFNNMIPVNDDALITFNIDGVQDAAYRLLLKKQIDYINRNKSDILNHAAQTYYDVVNGKNKFLVGISCDFKKLEKYSDKYDPSR